MVNFKIIFLSIMCCILLASCEQNQLKRDAAGNTYHEVYNTSTGITERTEYYPNGKVRAKGYFKEGKKHGEFLQFYENGKLEATVVYRDDVLEGISKAFYPSGKLKGEIYYSKGLPVGWSYDYWENGEKKMGRHFVEFNGDSRRNQFIVYNDAGVAINDSSHYMTINSSHDTIPLGEEITLRIKLEAPFYGSKSQVRVLVGGFDEQYRLVNPAATDTINVEGLTAEFAVLSKKRGKNFIRGRLEDYKIEKINDDEFPYKKDEVHIYFTKTYYVK